ncbi:MAG TPA: hypothetical protein DIW17_18385 [Clostridiales bacterium]|nr:ATP-binding protein [Clostridia bacterium]HCS75827.1 hypothetical protein [Clostridiales bacterium]
MSVLYSKCIIGCESDCIRTIIKEMMDSIKSNYCLSAEEEYEFRLILNELIANGTVHGNKNHYNKTISAKIEAIDLITIGITIEDEGSGFDYHEFFTHEYPCDSNLYLERGRGLKLIKSFCDNICFNQTGNQIKIRKRIEKSPI